MNLWNYIQAYPDRLKNQFYQGMGGFAQHRNPVSVVSSLNPTSPFIQDAAVQAGGLIAPQVNALSRLVSQGSENLGLGPLSIPAVTDKQLAPFLMLGMGGRNKMGFYSPSGKALTTAPGKGQSGQYLAHLKKEPGATKEAKETGLLQALEQAPGTLTKEEVVSMWNPKGGSDILSRMKARKGEPIPDELKNEMVSVYNQYLDSPDDILSEFLNSSDSDSVFYYEWALDDLVDTFGDDIPEDALEIVKKHGKVVETSNSQDAEYFSPDSAPSEAEFYKEAAEDRGWLVDRRVSTFDELLSGEPDSLQLSSAFEKYADNLEGWDWEKMDGSSGSDYFRLLRQLTKEETNTSPELAEETDGMLDVGVRVSNHARQSQHGHATRGKAAVDINIAPSKDGDNIYHYAESFEEAHDRLGRATVNMDGEVIFPGQLLDNFTNETRVALADIPDSRLQEATSEGYDLSTIWYHGTPSEDGLYGGIDKNPTKHSIYNTSKEPGFFITRDPDMAADYAGENGVIEKLVIKHESGRYYPEIPGGYTTDRGSGQILEFGDTDYSRSPTVVPGAADSFIPFNLVDESVLIIKGSKLKNLRD